MDEFPVAADKIVRTAADLFRAQGRADVARIMDGARAWTEVAEYDNWRGGTTCHTLHLELPTQLYASVEPDLGSLEQEIQSKLAKALRTTDRDVLTTVVITPTFEPGPVEGPLDSSEASRLWDAGMFRLFLSHVSAHKVRVARLKESLGSYGVSAFVAHEDIEPSLEWQGEIELALRSMDAMAALITPDFHGSNWTDQEVGIALGRGHLVLPVRLPTNPYGFIAKNQGLRGDLASPSRLASDMVDTLLRRPRTMDQVREGLVRAIEIAGSYATAKAVTAKLEVAGRLTPSQGTRVLEAIESNNQVSDAITVPSRLRALVPTVPAGGKVADELDDLPV